MEPGHEAEPEAVPLASSWADHETGMCHVHPEVEASPLGRVRVLFAGSKAAALLLAAALGTTAVAGLCYSRLSPWKYASAPQASPASAVNLEETAETADPAAVAEPTVRPPLSVKNWGQNCWAACGGSGNCPSFCGAGSACCRYGSTKDPQECKGVQLWGSKTFHTCVAPVNSVSVLHSGQDCWEPCQGSGRCTWCGHGNACCRWNRREDPPECKGVTSWPSYKHHTCVAVAADEGAALGPPPVVSSCLPGEVMSESTGSCEKASEPATMRFYMYRAQNGDAYHTENVNMASLTGVLWYLHNEVVVSCPRKFGLTKIVRYVATMKNPPTLFKAPLHYQFGQFVQFDSGVCTWNNSHCENLWNKFGYVVGCQPLDVQSPAVPNYAGPPAPVWYSLPGKCPSQPFKDKTDECMKAEPGGECKDPDGTSSCTWRVDPAGEIMLNELTGSSEDASWCTQGNLEYNKLTDEGVGSSFWNNRRDPEACRERVAKVETLFQQKYPAYPATLGEPPCDWWR